jgi:hypothetical protein
MAETSPKLEETARDVVFFTQKVGRRAPRTKFKSGLLKFLNA